MKIEFCYDHNCGSCRKQEVAYFVHQECWKLTRRFPLQDLYMFAKDTYPMFESDNIFDVEATMPIDFVSLTRVAKSDSLSMILQLLSNLPLELRQIIAANCYPSMFFSLFVTNEISCPVLDQIRLDSRPRILDLIYKHNKNLSATFVTIFGTTYISSLEFNAKDGIRIEESKLKGIKFVMGPHGLLALCILYNDGLVSPLLGQCQNGWFGVLYGDDIQNLQVLQDVSLSLNPYPNC
ncbi:hypothetical protein F5884DRAFT_417242 [Xylogone sp. PMI_703]|nr:hypothetical protein F5884DRAFT_417242 [Xylogone sp. PMI_703]